ncbi:MAG: FAD:protein FMN transferase [Armatimonadetes bacterium]|nr:FAD:protein FMN transferase [Armatimonadota bacterium]
MARVGLATFAMATRFEIVLEDGDHTRLRAAGEEALAEIEMLDRQLSRFRPDSDVSLINAYAAERPAKVEPRLFDLLKCAVEISGATYGAFDVTVAPLMKEWGFGSGGCRIPNQDELARARSLVGMHHLILDRSCFTVHFDKPGVEIDLGAIGKGYAIDRAFEILKELGVTHALLHGGTSTVYAIGDWQVGIPTWGSESPINFPLSNCALSVSAVHGRSFTANGREFGHVINPSTGEPISYSGRAVVWGPSATYCDALSTALLVLGEEWLPELTSRFPGYSGQIY